MVAAVWDDRLDIGRFQSWALGNLVGNTNRGIFAEWLVGQALGAIGRDDERKEWDETDLSYGDVTVEVKASGRGQSWKQNRPSVPEFDIEPRKSTWNARTGEEQKHDLPKRVADVYVFCLHEPVPATSENVRDLAVWRFWVVSTRTLDDELGPQKSVRLSTLNRLAEPIGWSDIRTAVDRCVNGAST